MKKNKSKKKPGPEPKRLVITEDPEAALEKLLKTTAEASNRRVRRSAFATRLASGAPVS